MDVSRPARMLVSSLVTARPVLGGISVQSQRCGELLCSAHEYCSQHLLRCRPCTEVCTLGQRNYQRSTCDLQCQDYLHDMTYIRKADQRDSIDALVRVEKDLERLTIMVGVMFCLLVVCFLWLVFQACSRRHARWRKRKAHDIETDSIQLKSVGGKVPNGSAATTPVAQVIRDKASTVPQYTLGRHNPSYVMATKNGDELKSGRGRHPAEDTCPADYSAAYDNPALAVTPPLHDDADGAGYSHPLAVGGAPDTPPAARARESRTAAASQSQRRRAAAPDPRRSGHHAREPAHAADARARQRLGRADSGQSADRDRQRPPLDVDVTDGMYSSRPVHAV